jgi:hypothetical protein
MLKSINPKRRKTMKNITDAIPGMRQKPFSFLLVAIVSFFAAAGGRRMATTKQNKRESRTERHAFRQTG